MNAIVLQNVVKHFRKRTIRRDHTTFKTELIHWLLGRKRPQLADFIQALKGVDLEIPRGKTVGIIGRNGSGKSTLLKLITGIYTPTSGSVEVHGRISALLDLGAGFHPEFSGRENILINGIILGMSRAEVKGRMEEIIQFAELGEFIDEPVRTYSSGMYMRLAFAVATHVDPDILLIDEILAVGDEHFSKKSLAKMQEFKGSGRTIVLVTHDLGTVQKWCDLAAWVDGGKIRLLGEPGQVVGEYVRAVAAAEAQAGTGGASPLSTPGVALPEVAKRKGEQVEIREVRILPPSGKEQTALHPEGPMQICIDFEAHAPVSGLGFSVEVLASGGARVYAMETEVPLPVASPLGCATLTLELERLGLAGGEYTVDVVAGAGELVQDERRGVRFSVRARGEEKGLVCPPHRWRVELAQPRQRAASSAG